MNAAAFALVLLAAGYVLLRYTPFTRASVFRTDGHALYFMVVAASLAIAAYTAVLLHELSRIPAVGEVVGSSSLRLLTLFGTEEKAQALGKVAIAAVPAACLLAALFRLPVRICDSLQEQLLLSQSSISEIEEFLWMAASRSLPVMLTLGSGKVYVGTTIRTAAQRDDRRWLRLEPLMSGFRDDKHTFQMTTSYAWLHSERTKHGDLPIEDFDILIPFDDVKSAHAFDLPTYRDRFSTESTPTTGVPAKEAPSRPRHSSKAVKLYYGYVVLVTILPLGSFLWGAPAAVAIGAAALVFGGGASVDERR